MPELPEVETARRSLEKALKGKTIARVKVDLKDRIGFDRASPSVVKRAMEGAIVKGCGRKGKYFWLELDRRPWPVFHLGMSGNVEINSKSGFDNAWGRVKMRSQRNREDVEDTIPRYCRMLIQMNDGTMAAITDPRRFGRIRLAQDPLREAPIAKLGADPLEEFPSVRDLQNTLNGRRAPIKAVLLDQSIFAGVGNWLADEILFQARVSPHRLAKDLTALEIGRLRTRTLGIIKKAISVDAEYQKFPSSWIFHDRWNKRKESYTSRGYLIQHDTVGGRTTAWVPELQR